MKSVSSSLYCCFWQTSIRGYSPSSNRPNFLNCTHLERDHCASGSTSVGVSGVNGVVLPPVGGTLALDGPFGLGGARGSFVSKMIVIGP